MTHRQVILYELSITGRTTYRELLNVYGPRGYTRVGFVCAARRLWARGLVVGPAVPGGAIVRASVCPCCGRAL